MLRQCRALVTCPAIKMFNDDLTNTSDQSPNGNPVLLCFFCNVRLVVCAAKQGQILFSTLSDDLRNRRGLLLFESGLPPVTWQRLRRLARV